MYEPKNIPGKPLATMNDSEGTITREVTPAQPDWERNLKRALAAVVTTCGGLVLVLPEHTWGYRICFGVVAVGAALGITSKGNQ